VKVLIALPSHRSRRLRGVLLHAPQVRGKLIYLIMIVPLMLCLLLIFALIPDVMHGPLFNPAAPTGISGH
jgi:hypothetical protein